MKDCPHPEESLWPIPYGRLQCLDCGEEFDKETQEEMDMQEGFSFDKER